MPANTDATRRVGTVTLTADPAADRVLAGARRTAVVLGRLLAAAEATGGAATCVTMASEYAKVREQFGRVIGMFQAVKHQAADMFVATQLATAATWDAARTEPGTPEFELAVAIAATQALPTFVMCAEKNIQLHGGIGFTWEHDAHIFLKRAVALAAVFGPTGAIEADVARLTDAGVVGAHAVELPPEAETYRAEVRAFIERYRALPDAEQLGAFLDSGYALAHWPKPWGRAASAVEQLVIDEELARRGRAAAAVRDRRLGDPDHHPARRRRPDRTLDPPEPRARVRVVPAVQRTGRGLRRRRDPHPGHARPTAAGWSTGRRCGRAARRSATAASPPCAPIPTSPSTTASP